MRNTFPSEFSALKASEGSPVDLQRIANESLRKALEEMRCLLVSQSSEMKAMRLMLQRRTAVLSPSKGFSNEAYYNSGKLFRSHSIERPLIDFLEACTMDDFNPSSVSMSNTNTAVLTLQPSITELGVHGLQPAAVIHEHNTASGLSDIDGVYQASDASLRAYVNESPRDSAGPRIRSQVDLVLPPIVAFNSPSAGEFAVELVDVNSCH